MNDRPVFSIGEQHAGLDIFIASDFNVNLNSSAEDILNWLGARLQRK